MGIVKAYTSLEQSKILAEFLPFESADMCIGNYVGKSGKVDGTNVHYYPKGESFGAPEIIYGWSLAALLNVLPDTITSNDGIAFGLNVKKNIIEYSNPSLYLIYKSVKADNLIDACVEMIERLHELNLL